MTGAYFVGVYFFKCRPKLGPGLVAGSVWCRKKVGFSINGWIPCTLIVWTPFDLWRNVSQLFSRPRWQCHMWSRCEVNWLLNLTISDFPVIYVTAHRWRSWNYGRAHGVNLLYGYSEKPPHLVTFYETLGIRRTHSPRLNPWVPTGEVVQDKGHGFPVHFPLPLAHSTLVSCVIILDVVISFHK